MPRSEHRPPDPRRQWFQTTHWSIVQAVGGDSSSARVALEQLCRVYWYPLYAFARRSGQSAHDAEDAVQSFFLSCLEKDWLAAADRAKGRFRSFLLVAFKRFAAKELAKSRTRKRGGDRTFIELDALSAEKRYACEPTGLESADRLYERRWALTLLEQEQTRAGNERTFTALKEFLSGNGRGTAYAELAGPLGLSEGAVKVAVHRLRRRYREMLEAEIANTVSSPDEIEEERRFLLNALS